MIQQMAAVLAVAATSTALAAVPAGAATPRSCGDVVVSNAGGSSTDLGVKATGLACATAKQMLRKAARTNRSPAGWTFGNTYVRFDQASSTSTCGYFFKRGKKRITWHTTGGDGCT
jgi:hypothetical protein